MNAALGSRAFLLFRRRRLRIFAVRLRRHIQESSHDTLHALRDFFAAEFIF